MLLFVHLLLAIVSVGLTLSFPLWRARADRVPEARAFTIRTIRRIDRTVVIPAYALQLPTGIALAVGGGIPLASGWLVVGTALYLAAAAIGALVLGPLGRRQLALLDAGTAGDGYAALARRVAVTEAVVGAMLVAVVALMVLKPF